MQILQIKDLASGFNNKNLFQNLSFVLNEPAFIAIIGLNGSGKSTFLKALLGKQSFYGNITVKGLNISTASQQKIAKHISYLGQKNSLGFSICVVELVVMGLFREKNFFDSYNKQDYEQAFKVLELLHIEHLAHKDFLLLSGGEQQLVWIAQMLLQKTTVWLMDEPTQQLDLLRKKQVFNLFSGIVRAKGKTIFCVTHDIYNLTEMDGFFINISEKQPRLQTITAENLKGAVNMLEEQNAFLFHRTSITDNGI